MTIGSDLIILSAGGTGGHIMPAQALGRELLARGYRVEVLTDDRGSRFVKQFEGMPVHIVKSATLVDGIWGKVRSIARLGLGIFQALKLLKTLKPAAVVGFGGYPSFPGVYAAQKLGISTVLHEQNAIIGKANAMLAAKAKRIALSLPHFAGLDSKERERAVVTGNPVRGEISALYNKPYPVPVVGGTMRILIMGGSMGASVFSEIVPQTLAKLSSEYRARLHIVQQCRREDIEATRAAYEAANIKADLAVFFDDVPDQLGKAHLVIGRSGASTVAEVATAGRPSIFVPYPYHKDQQQKMNAEVIADNGGAWVMTQEGFTVEALLARMETLLQNPDILTRAAEKARECGQPEAAKILGDVTIEAAGGQENKEEGKDAA